MLTLCMLPVVAALAGTPDSVSLFDGKDLSHWVPVNVAPETFTVQAGELVCNGHPLGFMRTAEMYENFVLELDWKHFEKDGNSGVFVWADGLPAGGAAFPRSIEVQVMVGSEADWYTSDGDLFPIFGATMTPDHPRVLNGKKTDRSYPTSKRVKPADWNHYRVECSNGTITHSINGEVVNAAHDVKPRLGYVCLESEGSLIHFKNITLTKLPSSGTTPPAATASEGWTSLFNGDFRDWDFKDVHTNHFVAKDNVISFDGKGEDLWSKKKYKNFELICDWRWTGKGVPTQRPIINADGSNAVNEKGEPKFIEVSDAGDSGIYLRGSSKSQVNIWCWPCGSGEVYGYRTDPAQPAAVKAGVTPKVNADTPIGDWNRFRITMNGTKLSVVLNEKLVLDGAELPGVATEGPIALQKHDGAIEFRNIFIRELP